ncbi:50S ribosomal protein L4 [Candidatus Saccharibacteria bacterium]|nr:50S ribosomal protein L4 [Candidatus Saccharibacteria bacterium]MBR2989407.1 50S ribosomal protein L4 [Candidatus Saccharibacteria bacterium]
MAETTTLSKDVFGLAVENHELVKLAYDAYLANSRSSHAKTLKRGEVRGGGKKPWKQKGTGRARFGSTRNPIWRHGGVAFGRTGEENFEKKISRESKKVAVRQALSLKNKEKAVVVIDNFTIKNGKTKEATKILENNKIDNKSNILLVVSEKSDLVIRATSNLAHLKAVRPTYLNVFDIMNADKIVIVKDTVKPVENWLLGKENA